MSGTPAELDPVQDHVLLQAEVLLPLGYLVRLLLVCSWLFDH